MRKSLVPSVLAALAIAVSLAAPSVASASNPNERIEFLLAPGFRMEGLDVVYNPNKDLDFLRDFAARNDDGTVNAVIEIPAGDNRKFETDPDTGKMFWELKNGKPRIVKFTGYPGNYGAVPGTRGGDGDPLDVVTLGRMDLRASVVAAKVIGVMYMVDGGENDEKLVAVLPGTFLEDVNSIDELDETFPGVTDLLRLWFVSYKGPGEIEVSGFGGPAEANAILDASIAAFPR